MNQSLVNILIVVVAAIVLFVLLRYLNSKNVPMIPNVPLRENFEANPNDLNAPDTLDNGEMAPYNNGSVQAQGVNKPQLTASELLPQDNASSEWAQANPSANGSLKDKNFLQAGHHIGINSVGQSLRNANLQLRSDPPNPQTKVSPWLQSTIDPDTNRQSLEIGGCNAL
jgi:hypothetical protein